MASIARILGRLLTISIGASLICAPASACVASIYKQSVVLNTLPDKLPEGVHVYHVRIEEALFSERYKEIQGLRGRLLEPSDGLREGAQVQMMARLTSNCDDWIEYWSSDHQAKDGQLIGYVIGQQSGSIAQAAVIRPMLFHNTNARTRHRQTDGEWANAKLIARNPQLAAKRLRIASDATWRPFRVDIEALGAILENVDRQIKEHIEKMDGEQPVAKQQ